MAIRWLCVVIEVESHPLGYYANCHGGPADTVEVDLHSETAETAIGGCGGGEAIKQYGCGGHPEAPHTFEASKFALN